VVGDWCYHIYWCCNGCVAIGWLVRGGVVQRRDGLINWTLNLTEPLFLLIKSDLGLPQNPLYCPLPSVCVCWVVQAHRLAVFGLIIPGSVTWQWLTEVTRDVESAHNGTLEHTGTGQSSMLS
jgi:hypothetical protein